VVSRFRTYGVELSPELAAYSDAVWALPAVQEWLASAAREPKIEQYERLLA
jgi:glutathione S-transferase